MEKIDNFNSFNEEEEISFFDLSKEELCDEVSKKSNVPKEQVEIILNAFIKHQIDVMGL
jgi:hypothetical protein